MEFDNAFEVPLPPAEAWKVLMDIERIVPCLPGAALSEILDRDTYKGTVAVRLGPVALTFAGEAKFAQIDAANHRARVAAQGRDNKGRGGASATMDFQLEPVAGGSKVTVHTDLSLSGSVAQYGRGAGMIQDLAARLIGQFAAALKAQLATQAPATSAASAQPSAPPPAKPISGLALLLRILWDRVVRMVTGRRQIS
jgi:carbon monoxide dehydrogenase subunit G